MQQSLGETTRHTSVGKIFNITIIPKMHHGSYMKLPARLCHRLKAAVVVVMVARRAEYP